MSTWSGGRMLTQKQREEKREKDRMTKRRRKQAAEMSTLAIQSELEYLRSSLEEMKEITSIQAPSSWVISGESTSSASTFHQGARLSNNANLKYPPSPVLAFLIKPPYLAAPPPYASTDPVRRNGRSTAGARMLQEFSEGSSTSLVQQFNETLARVYQINTDNVCLDEKLNQDILIRGVLNGWSNLDYRSQRCPLWDILREIDEGLFVLSDLMTRFSMLRAVHFLLLFFVGAWNWSDLPSWLRPRPSQLRFPHSIVVDYFAWPGLRERLSLADSQCMTNSFWGNFALSFRLDWPNKAHASYYVEDTGLYQFTGLYKEKFCDIAAWTMGSEFFDAFPDMCDDIMMSCSTVDRGVIQ